MAQNQAVSVREASGGAAEINCTQNGTAGTTAAPSIYRKAKLWQIILFSLNALSGMAIYMLMGMAALATESPR